MERYRITGLFLGLLALVALWMFPYLLFANPGPNDAPILWTAPVPVAGATVLGSLAAVIVHRMKKRRATASVALGTYMVGVAAVFMVGLVTVANLSNDRFWPFLLAPAVFAPVGTILLLVALVGRAVDRPEITRGLVIGGAATLLLLAWMLARGSRDWLLAPYGFDVFLLIALQAAAVYLIGRGWRRSVQTIVSR